jgi:biotin carboxylase
MPDDRVIVVGTTSDYISLLSQRYPDRILFVTDTAERKKWPLAAPAQAAEIVCDLLVSDEAIEAVKNHLEQAGYRAGGIVSFDCESMSLAARLAEALALPYPSPAAIVNARSKFLSKQLWQEAGVPCPKVALVHHLPDLLAFFEETKHPVVVKPLTGSGSELVFACESKQDCIWAHRSVASRLAHHPNTRMYLANGAAAEAIDPRKVYSVEELIQGREYSCDFIMEENRFEIIRIAQKIPAPDRPLGTIMAYVLPGVLPGEMNFEDFRQQIYLAAKALGLTRAMGMVDFIVRRNVAYLLEMTPRPGGDCLPELMRRSSGFDILGSALDFSENKPVVIPDRSQWKRLVGLRLFAAQNGTIKNIDTSAIQNDSRVLSCQLKIGPGHEVILPPDDYDSQLLGTIIFEPTRAFKIKAECLEIAGLLKLDMETPSWAIPKTS